MTSAALLVGIVVGWYLGRLLFASAVAFQVVAVFVHLFLSRALSIHIGLGELFIIAPATMLLTSLPISVNGIGVREACYVIGFGVCGVSEVEALAFSALTYSGHVSYCIVGGVILVAERLCPEAARESQE